MTVNDNYLTATLIMHIYTDVAGWNVCVIHSIYLSLFLTFTMLAFLLNFNAGDKYKV